LVYNVRIMNICFSWLMILAFVLCPVLRVSAQPYRITGDSTQTFQFDGKSVPYRLYVPSATRPKSGFPLLLALHGGGDNHHKYFTGYNKGEMKRVAEKLGIVVACPRTSPNGGYRGREEHEVLGVMADVKGKVKINTARVYIFGHSMGGSGALAIAAHHPSEFAAVAAFAGPLPPRAAGALRTIPVYLAHGDKDKIMPVRYSRELAIALRQVGAEIEYHEIKNADHNNRVAAEFAPILKWMLAHSSKKRR
jgi:poly(3-hydroxybutyrate) depolymerase